LAPQKPDRAYTTRPGRNGAISSQVYEIKAELERSEGAYFQYVTERRECSNAEFVKLAPKELWVI